MTGTDPGDGLVLRGVSKTYGATLALAAIDLHVAPGHMHGLLGRNGAGKSSLLGILLGLIHRDQGSITLAGSDLRDVRGRVPGGVAGCVEEPRLYPYLTGLRTLELLARLDDPGGLDPVDTLQRVGLAEQGDRKIGGYSLGMRARLGIAASLMRRPRLLVLDEPTSGLDPVAAAALLKLLGGLTIDGTSIVVSSHDLAAVADVCDRVTILRHGHVVLDADIADLAALAPDPVFDLSTRHDAAALDIASRDPGIDARRTTAGLVVHARADAMDAFVITLASHGVAVRRLTTQNSPLRALFDDLTDGPGDSAVAADESRYPVATVPTEQDLEPLPR